MAQWFIARGSKQHGPVDDAKLKQLAASGKLLPDDIVRREDMSSGLKAKDVEGLLPLAPAPQQLASDRAKTTSFGLSKLLFHPWLVRTLAIIFPPVGIPMIWLNPSWKKRQKVFWTALSTLCFILFSVWSVGETARVGEEVKTANALWDKSEKATAVEKYRAVLKASAGFVKKSERPAVFQRVIEADCEAGDTESAKKLIARARRLKVDLAFSSPLATQLLAQVGTEERQKTSEKKSSGGSGTKSDFKSLAEGRAPVSAVQKEMVVKWLTQPDGQPIRGSVFDDPFFVPAEATHYHLGDHRGAGEGSVVLFEDRATGKVVGAIVTCPFNPRSKASQNLNPIHLMTGDLLPEVSVRAVLKEDPGVLIAGGLANREAGKATAGVRIFDGKEMQVIITVDAD
jgi:hypothetical protein